MKLMADKMDIDVYMATDVESTDTGTPDACDQTTGRDSVCTWSLEGDDASLFEISNEAAAANGQLSFKNAPDFENPADADMDNVYDGNRQGHRQRRGQQEQDVRHP